MHVIIVIIGSLCSFSNFSFLKNNQEREQNKAIIFFTGSAKMCEFLGFSPFNYQQSRQCTCNWWKEKKEEQEREKVGSAAAAAAAAAATAEAAATAAHFRGTDTQTDKLTDLTHLA